MNRTGFKVGDKVRFIEDVIKPYMANHPDLRLNVERAKKYGSVYTIESIHPQEYMGYGVLDGLTPIFISFSPREGFKSNTIHVPHNAIEKIRHSNPIKRNSNMRDMYVKSSSKH